MVLKLDARVPLVWRDPFSLQFGVDPARVVLRDVSTADERIIHALSTGVGSSGLAMIAQSSGASDQDLARLMQQLEPLLMPEASPARAVPVVAIAGTGRTVDLIAESLVASGLRVSVSATPSDKTSDLGIAVGHYVLDPTAHGHWLRRDIPHLAITFGESGATVGPLVEPGRTPCLYCLEFYRRDADASWAAIASQLWGRRSLAETPLLAREVAARAARLVVQRVREGAQPPPIGTTAASVRIDTETGAITRREWLPHPACGCVEPGAESGVSLPGEARTGTDSAVDSVLHTRVVAAGERA
jgi:bacteriocin biosynthesis cyclodehydratase domain-containing protein